MKRAPHFVDAQGATFLIRAECHTDAQEFPRNLTPGDRGLFIVDRSIEREVDLVLAGPFFDSDAALASKEQFRRSPRRAMVRV